MSIVSYEEDAAAQSSESECIDDIKEKGEVNRNSVAVEVDNSSATNKSDELIPPPVHPFVMMQDLTGKFQNERFPSLDPCNRRNSEKRRKRDRQPVLHQLTTTPVMMQKFFNKLPRIKYHKSQRTSSKIDDIVDEIAEISQIGEGENIDDQSESQTPSAAGVVSLEELSKTERVVAESVVLSN